MIVTVFLVACIACLLAVNTVKQKGGVRVDKDLGPQRRVIGFFALLARIDIGPTANEQTQDFSQSAGTDGAGASQVLCDPNRESSR